MKKRNNTFVIGLFLLFICLLSLTIYTSFSSNIDTQEIIIKSMTPVYDETSGVVVDQSNVIFNDKNQVVKYNVVLENTEDYDVKISDIKLSTPTEEFLDYKVEGISKDEVLSANSTKELVVSFETMRIDGWGRNFADELTANISFEKVAKQEDVTPPVEEDKEEEKQPEAPAANIEEIVKESEKIEVESITNNTIEFKDGFKVQDVDKVEIWIYPETELYGYKEVDESNVIKEIVLDKNKLDELEITPGEHKIVISTEEKEILGYVDIYINENKELLIEKPQDSTNNEESNTGGNVTTKPNTDSNNKEDLHDDKVENPYTSDKKLVGVLGIATCIAGVAVIVASKNKLTKYTVFILMLSPAFTITNAEEVLEVAITNNVSFESQNVMKPSGCDKQERYLDGCTANCDDYWNYNYAIINFYVENEIKEIGEFAYEFDVTQEQNGRVKAYLVENTEKEYCMDWRSEQAKKTPCYDLYLQADGLIYTNENSSFYFADFLNIESVQNIEGLDTSLVTDMSYMFAHFENINNDMNINLNSFNTSNVINMKNMFFFAGFDAYFSFELDLSDWDVSKVTDMSSMFSSTATFSSLKLDLSGWDTSNVTNMSSMFEDAAYGGFDVDFSGWDTSNVHDMSNMFSYVAYSKKEFELDLSSWDTSNVINMSGMFFETCYDCTKMNIVITIKNPNISIDGWNGAAFADGQLLTLNYTNKTSKLVDEIIANVKRAHIVKGALIEDDNIYIGEEIDISGEKFNVISQTDDTVTMLAQYNLGTDYRQSTTRNQIEFAYTNGWEYTPRRKEIDIQEWSPNTKVYVNAYVEYLKTELSDGHISGRLITFNELETLGCTIQNENKNGGGNTCKNSLYNSWLTNGQYWWTQSATSFDPWLVWWLEPNATLDCFDPDSNTASVRPVITISKETLKNLV